METAVKRLGGRLEVLPSELDVSGGLPLDRRPSLLAAVEGVEAGRFVGIIVAYQSRLGRDVEYEEAVWRRVEAAGGRVEMALDGIDTSTVDGKMLRRIRSAMNAAERERHVERFDELRRWATDAGIWQRRQRPKGYSRDERTRRLIPNDEAPLVRRAFLRKAAGAPVSELARDLAMTTSGVRALLHNRVYLGELRVGEYVNPEAHPAIVTVDEFRAAQVWAPRPARRVGAGPALLAGLVRCQACGHTLTRGKSASTVYGHAETSSARGCLAPTAITMRVLDAHVERIARQELRRLATVGAQGGGGVEDARERLAVAERELAVYLEAVSAADVGADVFRAAARQRRDQVARAEDDLRRAMALRPPAPDYSDPDGLWEALTAHERNALLRGLVEVVIVKRAGGRGARVPLEDRVRVVAAGAGVELLPRSSGAPLGVRPLPWPDVNGPHVLRVLGGEDRS